MNFLNNLENLMENKKINRSELAKAIGIAPSTINAWYTKDFKGITLKNLSKLASFFDVSMEALVYGEKPSLTFTLDNYSEAELKAIQNGAAPGTVEVSVEVDTQRNIVRAIAVGATEMRSRDRMQQKLSQDKLLEIVAENLRKTLL